jgi:hypothetical protein
MAGLPSEVLASCFWGDPISGGEDPLGCLAPSSSDPFRVSVGWHARCGCILYNYFIHLTFNACKFNPAILPGDQHSHVFCPILTEFH